MSAKYCKWDIWYAKVKFEGSNIVKERPVLITGIDSAIILALTITTHPPRDYCDGEYLIKQWQAAGLTYESTIRSTKRLKLLDSDIIFRIGRLHAVDVIKVQNILNRENIKSAI